jgi:hypothetical protein
MSSAAVFLSSWVETIYESFSIFNVSVPPFQITSRVKGTFEWISIEGRSDSEIRGLHFKSNIPFEPNG